VEVAPVESRRGAARATADLGWAGAGAEAEAEAEGFADLVEVAVAMWLTTQVVLKGLLGRCRQLYR